MNDAQRARAPFGPALCAAFAMPSRKIEQQLEALSGLRAQGPTEQTSAALRAALADQANVVVAKAAKIAADLGMSALLPDLVSAFDRMFENPRESDPQCWGKNAIAKALKDLGHSSSQEFRRGLKHVQMEPVWGEQEDTATVPFYAAPARWRWCSAPTFRERT